MVAALLKTQVSLSAEVLEGPLLDTVAKSLKIIWSLYVTSIHPNQA